MGKVDWVTYANSSVSENGHQTAVFMWASEQAETEYPDLSLMHHIPNGGLRDKITAGRMKGAGVKAGIPDICLPVPRRVQATTNAVFAEYRFFCGLYIEMKKPGETPSKEQEDTLTRLRELGYATAVCDNAFSAVEAIKAYYGKVGGFFAGGLRPDDSRIVS